jgi:hypothetical protein
LIEWNASSLRRSFLLRFLPGRLPLAMGRANL